MKIYQIGIADKIPARFAGSKDAASVARREMVDLPGGPKFKEVLIAEVEVPTDKTGLLTFLNALVA